MKNIILSFVLLMIVTTTSGTTLLLNKSANCVTFNLKVKLNGSEVLFNDSLPPILQFSMAKKNSIETLDLYINGSYTNRLKIFMTPKDDTVHIVFYAPHYTQCTIQYKNTFYKDFIDYYKIVFKRDSLYYQKNSDENFVNSLIDSANNTLFEVTKKHIGTLEALATLATLAQYQYSKDSLLSVFSYYNNNYKIFSEYKIINNYVYTITDSSLIDISAYKVLNKNLNITKTKLGNSESNILVYLDENCRYTNKLLSKLDSTKLAFLQNNTILLLDKDSYLYWKKQFERLDKLFNHIYFLDSENKITFDLKLNRSPAIIKINEKGKIISMDYTELYGNEL